MKQESVKTNVIYNIIYNIVSIIVPIFSAPYISRVLGAANIGVYSYTHSIFSTLVMFGALGTATYGQREIAAVRDDIEKRSKLFWEIWALKAICTTALFGGFFFINYDSVYRTAYLMQLPIYVSAVLDVNYFFQGMEQFKHIAIRNTWVRIAGIILVFLLVKTEEDLWIYLLIVSVSQMLGTLLMWPHLRGAVKKYKITWKSIAHHLREVMIYFVPSITYQIYAMLDRAMLEWLVGSNYENGYYEQAHKIVNIAVSVISAYTTVMRSRMSVLFAKGEKAKFQKQLKSSYNVIAIFVFPMSFGLAAISRGMVSWFFGPGYDKVVLILYLFCPIFIFMGYSRLLGTHILTPSGRQIISNYAQISAATVNIILNALLIPRFMSLGAAIASVFSEFSVMLVYFIMLRKEISFREMGQVAWKKLVAAMAMFIVLLIVGDIISQPVGNTFTQISLGVAVYGVVLLMLKDEFAYKMLRAVLEFKKKQSTQKRSSNN